MNKNTFLIAVGAIFGIIALLHLGRVIYAWPAVIGTYEVPTWISWVALILAAYLSWIAFSLRNR